MSHDHYTLFRKENDALVALTASHVSKMSDNGKIRHDFGFAGQPEDVFFGLNPFSLSGKETKACA